MEHSGAFLSLPFFFGLGFALASVARAVHRLFRPVEHPFWRWLAALAAATTTAALFAAIYGLIGGLPRDWPLTNLFAGLQAKGLSPLQQFGLPDAALGVGAVAGWWFWYSTDSRDRAVFSGVAAAFVVLVALQYDTNILARVTKLGVVSVNIELSELKRPNGPLQGSQATNGGSEPSSGRPNTARTDLALQTLLGLAHYVVRDELFAQAFAGPNRSARVAIDARFIREAPADVRDFLDYACDHIETFAFKLALLQITHRSETSSLAVDPRVVAWLRREYYRTPVGDGAAVCGEAQGQPQPPPPPGRADGPMENIGDAFKHARQWTDDELDSIDREARETLAGAAKNPKAVLGLPLADGVAAQLLSSPPPTRIVAKAPSKATLGVAISQAKGLTRYCRTYREQRGDRPPRFTLWPRDSAYGAYLAIATAAAEAAVGNVESAVQLLDAQIERQSRRIGEIEKRCKDDAARKLDLARAKLALVRLENVQINLDQQHFLAITRNADEASGLALAERISHAIRHVEELLGSLARPEGDGKSAVSTFARLCADNAAAPAAATSCPPLPKIADEYPVSARYAAASLGFLDLKLRNNALYLIAERPLLARAFPEYADEDSADLLARFNFASFEPVGYKFDKAAPAYIQHTVGRFRELQAVDYGRNRLDAELPGEDRDTPRAERLCEAYAAYTSAEDTFKRLRQGDEGDPSQSGSQDQAIERIRAKAVHETRVRVWTALHGFPAHAIEAAAQKVAACKKGPVDDQ